MKESYDLGVNKRIFKPGDKVSIKIKNLNALYASKLQSPWSAPHEIIACKVVAVTLRNLSNNSLMKVYADRLSNPSITLRREPQAPANDVPLADSLILSSARNSDSDNSAHSSGSSRNSIPKGFHDIINRAIGKRKNKKD